MRIVQFGEDVAGFPIPVLNEREIRASAGLLFLAVFSSFFLAALKQNFIPIKYVITVFLADFLVRVFVNPKYAPTLIIGRMIVRNQVPEYVGARQKKFAWIIGVILASVMFVHLVVINAYGPISGVVCLICMIFLFFESAFGICLGCKVYPMIYKEKAQFCPGEVCDPKARQEIQRTSLPQILIVLGFIGSVVLLAVNFHGVFSRQPYEMFQSSQTGQMKKQGAWEGTAFRADSLPDCQGIEWHSDTTAANEATPGATMRVGDEVRGDSGNILVFYI